MLINEIMADNETVLSTHVGSLADTGLDWPGLDRISNPGAEAVDLSGWYLTDDAAESHEMAVSRRAAASATKRFLIVFASERQRRRITPKLSRLSDLDGFFHTNFKLSADGEYLALVGPDGRTVIHAMDA